MKLTFIHAETTGLPTAEPFASTPALGPEVTEYSILEWDDGAYEYPERYLVKPAHTMVPDDTGGVYALGGGDYLLSYNAHTWESAGAEPWSDADSERVHKALEGAHVAGANPDFATGSLEWELRRAGIEVPGRPLRPLNVCAIGYLRWVQGKTPNTSLGQLGNRCGVNVGHTAQSKVLGAVKVWESLYDEFIRKPAEMAKALQTIQECSPDEGMAEYAQSVLDGGEA